MQIVNILKTVSASRPPASLASAFEPHMSVFIDAQDKCVIVIHLLNLRLYLRRALTGMLAPHRGKNSRSSLDGTSSQDVSTTGVVLPSSTELFYFYGQTLEQCSKLFTSKPLLDLSILHRKWLRIYAEDVLLASLKKYAIFCLLSSKSLTAPSKDH